MKYISVIAVFCLYIEIIHAKGGKCDIGWENRGNKCYQLIYPPMGLVTKQIKLCKSTFGAGARAVSINSQEENDFLVEYAAKTMKAAGKYEAPNRAWFLTGGLMRPDKEFFWSGEDGSECPLNYTNWGEGEPDRDSNGIEVYLDREVPPSSGEASFYGKWNDKYSAGWASYENPIMCEKHAKNAKFDPKTCSYVDVKEDCIKIKKSTVMAILESCACSD